MTLKDIVQRNYPESAFGGFTRDSVVIDFFSRINSPILYRLFRAVHALTPSTLSTTLLIFVRKPERREHA